MSKTNSKHKFKRRSDVCTEDKIDKTNTFPKVLKDSFMVTTKKMKFKNFILIIIAIVVVMGGVTFYVLKNGIHSSVPQTSGEDVSKITIEPGKEGATKSILGKIFENSGFSIKINSYKDNIKSIGNKNSFTPQNGQFVILNVTISNIGNNTNEFLTQNQKLITNDDKSYSNSIDAASIYDVNHTIGGSAILPKQSITGNFIFDIKLTEKPMQLNFNGALNSNATVIPFG